MNMSAAAETESDAMQRCASCGITGGDDIKLKRCNACYLVRYCSVKCQRDHRPQHKKECKRRAAELHDEILFKQPASSHFGDCPICCLPVPIDPSQSTLTGCCSTWICIGCDYVNQEREIEARLTQKCPFCRTDLPDTQEEFIEQLMKRIEANDPAAIRHLGLKRYHEGDYTAAFEYLTRAATLGDVQAHYRLSCLYREGEGVEKDMKKELQHLTEAAIGGHPEARHRLGFTDWKNGRHNRAVKHWIIAAKLGYDVSVENLKTLYEAGLVSKEDFGTALRGHKVAIDATKSPQREEADKFYNNR